MPIVIADVAKIAWLDAVVQGWGGVVGHLWTNNRAPTDQDTLSRYVEADFPGYEPATISGWQSCEVQAKGVVVKTALGVRWVVGATTGTDKVYGVYYTDVLGRLLWAAELVNPPVIFDTPGQSLSVIPQIGLRTFLPAPEPIICPDPTPTPTPTPTPPPAFAFEYFVSREIIGASPEAVP